MDALNSFKQLMSSLINLTNLIFNASTVIKTNNAMGVLKSKVQSVWTMHDPSQMYFTVHFVYNAQHMQPMLIMHNYANYTIISYPFMVYDK